MSRASHHFPRNFKWGSATAAHQVEGDNRNNQWWAWEQQAGRIVDGDRSEIACDWWRSAEADFDRMAEMGLNAHRLSVEWSRIEPSEGKFDSASLDRYRGMLMALRKRGIEPMITLHHFTNPIWFEERGSWTNRDACVRFFARFVGRVADALGDLCDLWCTINEPNVYGVLGWVAGHHPPGKLGDYPGAFEVVRNLLLGHAAAYQVLHERTRNPRVGLAHQMRPFEPLRDGNLLDSLPARFYDQAFNHGILRALGSGSWPSLLRGGSPPSARVLRGTLDWIGLNYYTRERITFDLRARETWYAKRLFTPGAPVSDFNYGELYAPGFLRCLGTISRMGVPIYVTENGVPDAIDSFRPGFLLEHLKQLWLAIQFCYDVHGYYHWSFVDNFEWSEGWRMKFGLYELNRSTQGRTLRPSGRLYGNIVQTSALTNVQAEQFAPESLRVLFP